MVRCRDLLATYRVDHPAELWGTRLAHPRALRCSDLNQWPAELIL